MSYFPFFVELTGKNGLVVGGGTVALCKLQKLQSYGAHLTAAAPSFISQICTMNGVACLEVPYSTELLEGMDFVIAATDDLALNRRIAQECQARRILVNVVDDKESCGFLFPALVKQGELSIGISTGGASPSAAVYVKECINASLPEQFEAILEYLSSVRETVKETVPPRRRSIVFKALFDMCMEKGRSLTQAELSSLLAKETEA